MTVQPIILAAGKGTRMNNSELPKVMAILNGKPMITYLLHVLQQTEFLPPVIVVGYQKHKIIDGLGADSYTYVTQEEQLGTGHAVSVCKSEVSGKADTVLVINGDQPLTQASTMRLLMQEHIVTDSVASLATFVSDQETFAHFGRIIREESGRISAIREYKDATEEERLIQEYNPGLYAFKDSWLWEALEKVNKENAQGEFYLTDLLQIAVEEGENVSSVLMPDWKEALGINSPEQLRYVESLIQA